MRRRVVVTGLGVVASPGVGKERFWAGITSGQSFVGPLTRFDASRMKVRIASEIQDDQLAPYLNGDTLTLANRSLAYTRIAADLALGDSELRLEEVRPERCGVVLGTSTGPTPASLAAFYEALLLGGRDDGDSPGPLSWMAGFPSALVRHLELEYGAHGFSTVVSTGCAAGGDAIGVASEAVSWGLADVVLAVGAEAPIERHTIQAFDNIRALSHCNDDPEHASRPFDRERDGFVIGEGAVVLVLEERGHALLRGARVYGEVRGYATTTDAYHVTAPCEDLEKASLAVRRALEQADLGPEDVDYVSAHATSTPLGDTVETNLIKNVFGERAYEIPVSSLKSIMGHPSGAAGAMQAAANLLTLENQMLIPTVNLSQPDPDCDLDYVANTARPAVVDCIVQQTFGFSGKNSILVFAKA
jgi:3-oxoacyl-[acyl-carrier-protein] synthase II